MKKPRFSLIRMTALLLVLVCVLGLLPATALAASPGTIKMDDCAYNGVKYDSPALGECYLHQMHFGLNGNSTMGFCAEKGKGMGWSLKGHTWGNPKPVSDPTVKTMMYAFVEVSAPSPFATLTEPVIAHVDQATINGGGTVTVTASDKKLPNLTILKRDAQTGDMIPDTHFEIKGIHYGYHNDVTTGLDGKAVLSNIPVDSYEVTEISVPDPWVVSDNPTQTIWLEAGDSKELIFDNLKQPLLKISKIEKGTNPAVCIPNTNFLIEAIDGDYRQDVTTGPDGTVELRVAPGSYKITERSVPEPYYVSDTPTQTVSLNPGDEKEVRFENQKKPLLTLKKIDADTQAVIPGTVLTVKALDGTYQDDWTTGADGTVSLRVAPGTYQITEKSVPSPYYLPDKDADRVQTVTLSPGDEKTVVFRNRKAPELTIFKENSITVCCYCRHRISPLSIFGCL